MRNATDITILLDRSGSMDIRRQATIENFNKFLADQQAQDGECTLSLMQFSSALWGQDFGWYTTTINAQPIAEVKPLTLQSYFCNGGTSLLDAVGKTIVDTGDRFSRMAKESRPSRVVLVIITDGEENGSRSYTKAKIREMIAHQESKYAWSVTFLGAGIDAFTEGAGIGVSAFTTASVANNMMAYNNMYAVLGQKLAQTRSADAWTNTAQTMAFNASDLAAMSVEDEKTTK